MENGKFFTKEVVGEQVIGGGLVYTGVEIANYGIDGLVGAQNGTRLALNTGLKLFEGWLLAKGEEKATGMWKDVAHGAKIITPGTIPLDVANYLANRYYGTRITDLAAAKGLWVRQRVTIKIAAMRVPAK